MKTVKCLILSFVIGLALFVQGTAAGTGAQGVKPVLPGSELSALPLSQVTIEGGFWGERQELVRKTTMRAEWKQLESHHHVDNFRVVAGVKAGIHQGAIFLDSDLYKWLEAASYYIGRHPGKSHMEVWMRAQ